MIFDRLTVLRAMFPGALRRVAPAVSRRWREAQAREPDLAADLIGMGAVLAMQPRGADGVMLDREGLAYEAGRRDLALEVLALMGVGPDELIKLMEMDNASD